MKPLANGQPAVETNKNTAFYAAMAPALFVLLWSTGFIGAKFGLPYAEPFTFLLARFVIAACLLYLFVILRKKSRWPTNLSMVGHIAIAGLLLHAGYLGAVFAAIAYGMSAGLSALIVSLQPILTAIFAQIILRETVNKRQWLGLILGLAGVSLVVISRMGIGNDTVISSLPFITVFLCIFGLLSITFGSLYQKKFCADMPVASGTAIQYSASAVAMLILALLFETMHIDWAGEFIFALSWLILVLSFGAVALLIFLIRQNAASKLASMFYLVPPVTAIEAYFLFGEKLEPMAFIGMFITVIGVALVVIKTRAKQSS